ncbi:putative glutamine synthetase [Medicago truncatula]|uniref:Putative glutamine synthetase n=1 Tax=Medicago truncatula TaxID=3880 RepID=A0A396JSB8_MEDTR|nr:putative glutamine synthetase [Medicago truncatula]
MGITVEQLHAECGKGQFEIVLGHNICTEAADNIVYTRETVRAIARKHGLLATFVPKYTLDDAGSGCHVHLSLWQNDQNVFIASDESSKHGISTLGKEFMAGVLYHLPSILPFLAPLPIRFCYLSPLILFIFLFITKKCYHLLKFFNLLITSEIVPIHEKVHIV